MEVVDEDTFNSFDYEDKTYLHVISCFLVEIYVR
jgi:hypothetical protein